MRVLHVLFSVGFLASTTLQAAPAAETVEVTVAHVFVPSKGYDDNDNIEVVLDGVLPNACYSVDLSQVLKVEGSQKLLNAKQFATKRVDGVCENPETLSAANKVPVPYTLEAQIGHLEAGQYTIRFKSADNRLSEAIFEVAPSPAPLVDSLPYASVSGIHIKDVYSSADVVKGSLDGQITSTCMSLSPKLDVRKLNDIFVVRPTLNTTLDFRCFQLLRPFGIAFDLGKLPEGRYLVHVRSRNGKALNRAFSVVSPESLRDQ